MDQANNVSYVNVWLQWLLSVVQRTFNFLFSWEIMSGITFGSVILYFGLVFLAVIFLNRFFWGKANE